MAEEEAAEPEAAKKPVDTLQARLEGLTAEYVTREVLLGITICFAQIPESIAFAYMANVKPPIALHAAWIVGLICSVFGGRPGMVNGATGAFAAIIGTFIPSAGAGNNGEGVELLFPSVIFAGFLMLVVSALRLSRFITLLPSPVMIGFCNGLAIVIGLAQLHPFKDPETHEWRSGSELMWMLIICFSSMAIMEFFPKIPLKAFKVIPSSLLAIVAAVAIEFVVVRQLAGSRTNTIRDISEFTTDTAFPIPFFLKTDAVSYDLSPIFTADGIQKIVTQGVLLCAVGTIESLMTSEVVESFTKTPSDGDRTVLAMGVGNMISGLLGGMGGNAMIGLSTVNCLNGGRGRLGPAVAALGIMACVMGAYPLLNFIPVAALAGIMLVVVIHTFKWFSIGMLFSCKPKFVRDRLNLQMKIPRWEVAVIVVVTVLSNFPAGTNIAYAVLAGVAMCSIGYAWKSGATFHAASVMEGDTKVYDISGPLFFTSSNRFLKMMNPDVDPAHVEVRFEESTTVMDFSAMDVLNKITAAYAAKGKTVSFASMNMESQKMLSKANVLMSEVVYKDTDSIEADPIMDPLEARLYSESEVGSDGRRGLDDAQGLRRVVSVQDVTLDCDGDFGAGHRPKGWGPADFGPAAVIGRGAQGFDEKDFGKGKPAKRRGVCGALEDDDDDEEEGRRGKGAAPKATGCLFCVYYPNSPAPFSRGPGVL